MIEDMEEELRIVNEEAVKLWEHYIGIVGNGSRDDAGELACRGEIIARRELGREKARVK